jgi:hypothetical protein
MRERSPLAPGAIHVEERIEHFADAHPAWLAGSKAPGWPTLGR